jgi:hypothetical protein
MGQVDACGQRSTREGWASSMSCRPPAPGPHVGAQRRPGWGVPPTGTPTSCTSEGRELAAAPPRFVPDSRWRRLGQQLSVRGLLLALRSLPYTEDMVE